MESKKLTDNNGLKFGLNSPRRPNEEKHDLFTCSLVLNQSSYEIDNEI